MVVHVGTGNFHHWGIPRTEPTEYLCLDHLNEMFAYDLLGVPVKKGRESKNKNDRTDISCSSWVACFFDRLTAPQSEVSLHPRDPSYLKIE